MTFLNPDTLEQLTCAIGVAIQNNLIFIVACNDCGKLFYSGVKAHKCLNCSYKEDKVANKN